MSLTSEIVVLSVGQSACGKQPRQLDSIETLWLRSTSS